MNTSIKSVQNYLYIARTEDYTTQLYKMCFHYLKCGQLVLLFTRDHHDLSILTKEMNVTKEMLKYLVIMYFDTIESLASKLLELHDWVLLPSIVVVDLNAFVAPYQTAVSVSGLTAGDSVGHKPLLQSLCLCLAALFSYMESIKLGEVNPNRDSIISSISVLKETPPELTRAHLELLINLYYYKGNAFGHCDELQAHMQSLH